LEPEFALNDPLKKLLLEELSPIIKFKGFCKFLDEDLLVYFFVELLVDILDS
jgi:hypothetical protein